MQSELTFIPKNIGNRLEDYKQLVNGKIYKHLHNLLKHLPDPNVPLLISFSGGRTSALMAYIIMNCEAFKNYKKVCVCLPILGKN